MADSVLCKECGARVKAENEAGHMARVHPNVPFKESATARAKARAPTAKSSYRVSPGARKALFAVLVVAVVVVAGAMLLQSAQKGVPIDPSATPVRVSMSGFDPPTITVKAGTPLKIDLISMDNEHHMDGGGWHNFAIDDFGMNITVAPLGQRVFTVPTGTPGTYGWYCSMCCGGRASPSMNGRLIVKA